VETEAAVSLANDVLAMAGKPEPATA